MTVTALAATDLITARLTDRLARTLGPHRFSMWFRQSARLNYRADQRLLEIAVPNQFVADWIRRSFSDTLRQVLAQELGPQADIAIRIDPAIFRVSAEVRNSSLPPVAPPSAPPPPPGSSFRHRLDQFVVGPSNELAFAAASRLADETQVPSGPLFIHGGVGLGKTHLLQGICARFLQRRPEARVRYTTSEQFTNEFLAAIRGNSLDAFRRRIRQLDLLAVDDVHFIANKQATQQEFLHTFDALELAGARVALASDSHPKLIAQFSDALTSRCLRGLVVEIQTPDTETRLRIVRALAQRRGLSLMETVAATLARRCEGSIRELEGALTKLSALAALTEAAAPTPATPRPIGQLLVQRLWQTQPLSPAPRATRFTRIVDCVAQRLQMQVQLIRDGGRQRQAVLARGLIAFLARELTRMSYPEIARALNLSSHSTVIAAERRVRDQMAAGQPITLPRTLDTVTVAQLMDLLRQDLAA